MLRIRCHRKEPVDLDAWTRDYAVRRYGPSTPDSAVEAWGVLLDSVYDCRDLHPDHNQDIPVSRPGLDSAEVSPHGLRPQLWYKPEKVNPSETLWHFDMRSAITVVLPPDRMVQMVFPACTGPS